MSTKALGNNIRILLDEKRMTYAEFAEMIGVSHVTVCRWVSGGAGRMRADILYRVAEVLGTTVDALAREEPPCTDDAKSVGKS